MFDAAEDVYRLRPLTDQPLELDKLQYRNQREKQAFDLVLRQSAVTINRENRIVGSGVELTGTAKVKEDRREYAPQLRSGTSQRVTGLVVNGTGKPRVPGKTKRALRAAIHKLQNGQPLKNGETTDTLRGMAAFISMTDREPGQKLMDQINSAGIKP